MKYQGTNTLLRARYYRTTRYAVWVYDMTE